jgi:AmmeMemoRadiSam system protein B
MREGLYPARRDLDFMPLRHRGETIILVRDHLGLVPEGKALPLSLYEILALLDKVPDLRELQTSLMRRSGGLLVTEAEIGRILETLDSIYLLDSPRFRERERLLKDEFASLCARPPSHCGNSYPDDAPSLKGMLSSIVGEKGPGCGTRPKAVIAPHIDLSVGKELYGKAYAALRGSTAGRVVVLGVGHRMEKGLFSISSKDYETPLGRVPADGAAVERLREEGKDILEEDDFAHRSEHSIEFQTLFLQEVLGPGFKMIPVLCGPVSACLDRPSRDAFLERAGSFIQALREIVSSPDEDTLVVAGVDLSHIGPKFGHDMPASYLASEAQAHDRRLLTRALSMDPDGYWLASEGVRERYNVCGFSAIATALEILPSCSGTLLGYRMWHEDATSSAVAFAAAVFSNPS